MTDPDTIRRAMQLANGRNMRIAEIQPDPGIADIFCAKCGWPPDHRATKIDQYAAEPYGCPNCAEDTP